ncbi:hypothetical protein CHINAEXTREME_20820 (plasmid) [Halobiforma lacisalsi AJ5]|uniref:Uncharacterized protein n=2 Tax=Natronobacterium TaxID=2256 RepID=M0LCC2_NATLA|nr:hypothetical protein CHINAEXTREME_20820 [Halobiforma lacisalsi AJ5]EMA30064.1 hypothetical protein C445_16794 [Halobiforma lacisalsi AJ5]SFC67713.1 hypothetical protein SAMN05444422_11450 [Halobiforma haloterrestris]
MTMIRRMEDRQMTSLRQVLMISAEMVKKSMILIAVRLLQVRPVPQVLQLVLVPLVVLLQVPVRVLVLLSNHRKKKILKRVRTKRSQSLNHRR